MKTLLLLTILLFAGVSMCFSQGEDIPPELTSPAPQRFLLDVCEKALRTWVTERREIEPDTDGCPASLTKPWGVFVTIEKNGKLRGCRGTLYPRWEHAVRETVKNTVLAASKDPRFPPVEAGELSSLRITVTVVAAVASPPSVEALERLDPSRYGILVSGDGKSAVMLPGEATSWAAMLKWAKKRAGIAQGETYTLYSFRGVRLTRSLSQAKKGEAGAHERQELPLLTVGMEAPDFALPDLAGRKTSLRSLRGQVTILNFWAFWCDTWKEEVEKFAVLRREHPDLPYRILTVSIDGLRREKGLEAQAQGAIDFPVLLDYTGAVSLGVFGIRQVPTLFLLDERQVVRYKHRGYPGNAVIVRELRALQKSPAKADGGAMALTFDDFPHPDTAPVILDLLKEAGVKATFFVLGKRAQLYPDLVVRAAREGHELGNHSYSHIIAAKATRAELIADFAKTEAILERLTGTRGGLARAPGGAKCEQLLDALRTLGLEATAWDIESGDIRRPGEERIIEMVLSKASDRRIVLFHDGVEQGTKALPFILRELQRRGFRLVTAGELLAR